VTADPVERFEVSPVLLRPKSASDVSIESGETSVTVTEPEEPAPEEKPERPTRPPITPPWRVELIESDGAVASIKVKHTGDKVDPAATEARLDSLLAEHGEPQRLEVYTEAEAITAEELRPLTRVGLRRGIDIDVHLGSNG
jgi:hypothetical protein